MFPLLRRLLLTLILIVLGPFAAQAQEADDGTLHVLRPIIHAEQETAELCLEFDHALARADKSKVNASIHIESDSKNVTVQPRNVSVMGSELCLPMFEHRKNYRLTLSGLRGAAGEKLASSYSLAFTIPARRSSLVFVNDANGNGTMRWQTTNPVLRATNVGSVKIELFRLQDPARMVEAWKQRSQTSLAPSETATFAHTNGELAWQGTVNFDDQPDQTVEQAIPIDMKTAAIAPGFYLIVASAPELRKKETDLAPVAAMWLLRSGLRLHGLKDGARFYAFTEKADGSALLGDASIKIMDQSQKVITEGITGADGSAVLTVPDDRRADASTALASLSTGDVDFIDLTTLDDAPVKLASKEAAISTDAPFYLPLSAVTLTLRAHDIHGQAMSSTGSSLQLSRADKSQFAIYPVADELNGVSHVSFPAPASEGLWHLAWKQKDGDVLAETSLRVSSNPEAPRLEITADRPLLNDDGDLNLTLKAFTINGAPAAYVSGRVRAEWGVPDHVFAGWNDYHFGTGDQRQGAPNLVASFITNEKGVDRLHLTLQEPDDDAPMRAVTIAVASDAGSGAMDPPDLVLPLKPKDLVVGIKPLAVGGRFSENSLARFDVIVLGPDGKRNNADDLMYRLYEQGRSFDWFQADGRWQYKPLQQERRVGGGSLAIRADGTRRIEWPVTAGTYELEITDADGARLAAMEFSAGWGPTKAEEATPSKIELKPVFPIYRVGEEEHVLFTLTKPSIVSYVIADDRIRKYGHELLAQGDNHIAFTAQGDWGDSVRLHLDVESADNADRSPRATGDLILHGSTFETSSQVSSPSGGNSAESIKLDTVRAPNLKAASDDDTSDGDRQGLVEAAEQRIGAHKIFVTSPIDKARSKGSSERIFLATQPLYGLPKLLNAVLMDAPVTTSEIASYLTTLLMWQSVLVDGHLLSDRSWQNRKDEALTRLLGRQQDDGGFGNLPGATSDIVTTSAALMALSTANLEGAKAAEEQASTWLKHQLENTWVEEKDRPVRAAAFVALAAADRLDPASLRYYSDSSAEKHLPPVAAAQMATSFARSGDRDASLFWLNQADAATSAERVSELELLAGNTFFNLDAVQPVLAKLATSILEKPYSLQDRLSFAIALGHLQRRAGPWRVTINGSERSAVTVVAFPLPDKGPPPVIRNILDRDLFIAQTETLHQQSGKSLLTRKLLHMDGSEASGELKAGDHFVVVVEGPWNAAFKDPLFVHDGVGPALTPMGCALDGPGSDGFLAWLPPMSSVQFCEKSGDALDVAINHVGTASIWRIAYLVRAQTAGVVNIDPPFARTLGGAPDAPLKGSDLTVHIK